MVLCTWDSDSVRVFIRISLMISVAHLEIAPDNKLGGDGEQWCCLVAF